MQFGNSCKKEMGKLYSYKKGSLRETRAQMDENLEMGIVMNVY